MITCAFNVHHSVSGIRRDALKAQFRIARQLLDTGRHICIRQMCTKLKRDTEHSRPKVECPASRFLMNLPSESPASGTLRLTRQHYYSEQHLSCGTQQNVKCKSSGAPHRTTVDRSEVPLRDILCDPFRYFFSGWIWAGSESPVRQ
jgi:hypothetical protein